MLGNRVCPSNEMKFRDINVRRQLTCPVVLPQIEITLPGIVTPHHSKRHF